MVFFLFGIPHKIPGGVLIGGSVFDFRIQFFFLIYRVQGGSIFWCGIFEPDGTPGLHAAQVEDGPFSRLPGQNLIPAVGEGCRGARYPEILGPKKRSDTILHGSVVDFLTHDTDGKWAAEKLDCWTTAACRPGVPSGSKIPHQKIDPPWTRYMRKKN